MANLPRHTTPDGRHNLTNRPTPAADLFNLDRNTRYVRPPYAGERLPGNKKPAVTRR